MIAIFKLVSGEDIIGRLDSVETINESKDITAYKISNVYKINQKYIMTDYLIGQSNNDIYLKSDFIMFYNELDDESYIKELYLNRRGSLYG